MMSRLEKMANIIATREFSGTFDKAGEPYVYHLRYVAEKASCIAWLEFNDAEITELCYIVGLLHDLVEDIPVWDIRRVKEVFDEEIAQNVNNLTKREWEHHEDYLERVKSSKISTLVKIADSGHNSDITRFKNFDSFTEEKQKKIIEKSIFYANQKADLIEFLLNTERGK